MAEREAKMGPPELPPRTVLGLLNLWDYAEASSAMVVAGIVGDWLQTFLLGSGRQLSSSRLNQIFDGYGPLSSFSARIDIAYFFKLIDDTTHNDLRAIKNVRNCFAHSKTMLTFGSSEIVQRGKSLTGWNKDGNLRDLYYDRAQYCLDDIRAKMERQIFESAFEG